MGTLRRCGGKEERRKREKKSISSEEEDFRSAPTSINWEKPQIRLFSPIHRVEEHGAEEEEGSARGFEAFPSPGRCCWNTHTNTTAAAGSPLPITSLQPKGCLRTARRACSDSTFLHHPLQLANGGADRKKKQKNEKTTLIILLRIRF